MEYTLQDLYFDSLDAHSSFIQCKKCKTLFVVSKHREGYLLCPKAPYPKSYPADKPTPQKAMDNYHELDFIGSKKYFELKNDKR